MANELVIATFNIAYSKAANGAITIATPAISATVTGGGYLDNIQAVGTSEEAIVLGDNTAGGWFYCRNWDATNFSEVRGGTGTVDVIKMLPAEFALFRRSGDCTAPYAISDTASCLVQFSIFDL